MFRKDLGMLTLWRLKCLKKVGSVFGWTFISTIAILISTKANAAYQCSVTAQTCSWMYTGVYVQLVCKPITTCIWVPDPPPPPAPVPPPPPPPVYVPPPPPAYQQCIANAVSTGATCRSAYSQLNTICVGFNAYLGGTAAASSKWLYGKIVGSVIDDKTEALLIAGAAATGYAIDDSLVPCSSLTGQAMGFCSAGEAKMKSECK